MDENRSHILHGRAAHLRREALRTPGPLAVAYRRRAAELELQAAVLGTPTRARRRPTG